MPRSEITAMIQRARGMVEYVRENLTPQELDLFLDELAPLPEPAPQKTATKRASKKSNKSASKSARASGMEATIKGNLDQQRQSRVNCAHVFPNGVGCKEEEESPIHAENGGYLNYHPFVPAAPPARGRSSMNGASSATGSGTRRTAYTLTAGKDETESGGASSSTPSSEDEMASAGNAVQEASGGD